MLVHFWGVRGSLPTPLLSDQVQAKISAAIARITPEDVKSEESKMRFISSLPKWIYGTVGGNTACVEVKANDGSEIILDAGSGLRVFSNFGNQPKDLHYNLLFSHFHWDHIQGLPFFGQAFNPKAKIDVYAPFDDVEQYLIGQSSTPYFPPNGCWQAVKNQFTFHVVKEGVPFYINNLKIQTHKMNHPGDSYSYSIEEDGKKFIYCTDCELQLSDFDKNIERNNFFENADVLILDTQYTSLEAVQKENWGHSSVSNAIDFAAVWNVKKLYFFHHEPNYDDKKLYSNLDVADVYKKNYNFDYEFNIEIAREGQEFTL